MQLQSHKSKWLKHNKNFIAISICWGWDNVKQAIIIISVIYKGESEKKTYRDLRKTTDCSKTEDLLLHIFALNNG